MILVGERLAGVPGALSAALRRLADATGARLGWVPRRAGERGAVEAGALPTLLPGGRPVADAAARVDVGRGVGRPSLPTDRRPRHLGDPRRRRRRARSARWSSAASTPPTCPTRRPRSRRSGTAGVRRQPRAAPSRGHRARRRRPPGRAGRGEGRARSSTGRAAPRRFDAVLRDTIALSDARVLTMLADELGCRDRPRRRRTRTPASWPSSGPGPARAPRHRPRRAGAPATPAKGEAVLATWRLLLDAGTPAGRRAVPRRHRPRAGRPAVGGDRCRGRRRRRRSA